MAANFPEVDINQQILNPLGDGPMSQQDLLTRDILWCLFIRSNDLRTSNLKNLKTFVEKPDTFPDHSEETSALICCNRRCKPTKNCFGRTLKTLHRGLPETIEVERRNALKDIWEFLRCLGYWSRHETLPSLIVILLTYLIMMSLVGLWLFTICTSFYPPKEPMLVQKCISKALDSCVNNHLCR